MIFFNNSKATISYNTNFNYMLQSVRGILSSIELKELQRELLKLCEHIIITKIVADTHHLKVAKDEDLNWMNENIIQQLIKNGVKYFAIIQLRKVLHSNRIVRVCRNFF